jgi:hypothetical protein
LVAEGAHHEDPRALLRIGEFAGEDGDGNAKEGCERFLSEEVFVALIRWVGSDTDTSGEKLGPRCRDREGLAGAVDAKFDVVKVPLFGAILHLGLGNGRLKIHVPHGGGE